MNAEAASNFRPVTSLTEQIANHLSREIVQGTLAPGDRIQEQAVARYLQVSRGSVREALLILERRHLVDVIPRRGAVVSRFSRRQLDDLFDVQELLYTMIGQKMARMWDEEDNARFERALEDIAAAAREGDVDAYASACEGFIDEGLQLIRNRYLDAVVACMQPLARRALYRLVQLDSDLLTAGARSWRQWYVAMAEGDTVVVEAAVQRCFAHHRAMLTRSPG